MDLQRRGLIPPKRTTHALPNPDLHLVLLWQREEPFRAVQRALPGLLGHAVADEVEEAVGRAGMAHGVNDVAQRFGGRVTGKPGADVDSGDGVRDLRFDADHVCGCCILCAEQSRGLDEHSIEETFLVI